MYRCWQADVGVCIFLAPSLLLLRLSHLDPLPVATEGAELGPLGAGTVHLIVLQTPGRAMGRQRRGSAYGGQDATRAERADNAVIIHGVLLSVDRKSTRLNSSH